MTGDSRPARSASGKLHLLILPLIALIAVAPLLANGCSCGHDFDFHILSWAEAATQFAHGNLHPHWAFTPAFNAGEPRFVFYPPLSWTIGAILGLVFPWSLTPILYTALALAAAGLGCFYLLRDFAPPPTALLLAALYMANPYMLFTAYERSAYAELLAAVWFPLLLHAILRERVTIPRLAIPIALLWLTNAPAAVIGCYSLVLIAAVRLMLTIRQPHSTATPPLPLTLHRPHSSATSPLQLALNTIAGATLGLGLAGLYILPAAYERRSVQINMAMTDGMRISDNFLFHRTPDPDHDAVLHTASLIAVSLVLLTAAALLLAFLRTRRPSPISDPQLIPTNRTLIPLATLTALVALLQTHISALIWTYTPELPFLQFPWRFLAILTPVLALTLAIATKPGDPRPTSGRVLDDTKPGAPRPASGTWVLRYILPLLLPATLIFTGYRAFHQPCDPEDTVAARIALFHSPTGTDPTDEYTPITADNDALAKTNPPFWLAAATDGPPPPQSTTAPLHWPLDLTSPIPQILILNLRDYPAWHVSLNHHLIPRHLLRNDGLIAFPIPAGPSHIDITYTRTLDQTAGGAISAASLFVLAFALRRRRQPR